MSKVIRGSSEEYIDRQGKMVDPARPCTVLPVGLWNAELPELRKVVERCSISQRLVGSQGAVVRSGSCFRTGSRQKIIPDTGRTGWPYGALQSAGDDTYFSAAPLGTMRRFVQPSCLSGKSSRSRRVRSSGASGKDKCFFPRLPHRTRFLQLVGASDICAVSRYADYQTDISPSLTTACRWESPW